MAFPMCPWALLSGATVFISVMGGYATFLAPICGLMVCDYILVRKGKVKLTSLVSQSITFRSTRRVADLFKKVPMQPFLGVLL